MLPEHDKRRPLEAALEHYANLHTDQVQQVGCLLHFIRTTPDCFERHHTVGHITGSAWLLNPQGTHTLLTLHRKLGRWLQPGGHADGDADTLRVALREAEEESGITGISALQTSIFDVDIHEIPARPAAGEPAHLHYDIRYLLLAPHADVRISDESDALRWFSATELEAMQPEPSLRRMLKRWQAKLAAGELTAR